ncbi:DUF3644 domain-containing protein [Streptomyces sp. C3-3]|uniref:DUF3644 domain-containing protein n=1 Tax=Streptomyces sp. C3-3 TaxID=2824901 RepID=UPI001B3993AB|nr:DUF3644 domain-containing protein [Streptomyces sp. C3-3]MBQ1116203.1 hypothetical protein [Streptomyces sp. C3-3]
MQDFHFPASLNGLDFLESAVTSLSAEQGSPPPRAVKYGVVHLQLAAEILFKARLEMKGPEFVWEARKAFDQAKHDAGDFKSCGIKVALERLRDEVGLTNPIDPEDSNLKELGKLRNKIVHFGWKDSTIAVQARTVPVLDLLIGFVNSDLLPHLPDDDAGEAEQKMNTVRTGLRHLNEVIDRRRASIRKDLDGQETRTIACQSCAQFAVVLGAESSDMKCLLCGKTYGAGSDAAWEYEGSSLHQSIQDGGEDLHQCDWCNERVIIYTPVASSPDTGVLLCFACGTTGFDGVCENCSTASQSIVPETTFCTDCFYNLAAKF